MVERSRNHDDEYKGFFMITIDGSYGEGGGQMLRSALALSMVTGQAFTMHSIRAKRSKKGLLRQHLTAVKAAQQICSAEVTGAELNSLQLTFIPQAIKHGNYKFEIGTAGSTTLVLQAILPALLFADDISTVTITGGTHNQSAPPADFLQLAFLPELAKMGANVELNIRRHGFFPAGGGEINVTVHPCKQLKPLVLIERGQEQQRFATSVISNLPSHIAERELASLQTKLGLTAEQCRIQAVRALGNGNVLLLAFADEHVTNVFTGFGEYGVSAEKVATLLAKEAKHFLSSSAAVDEYLADQLLLPMALAKGGSFTTNILSDHCVSNIHVIEKFLAVKFSCQSQSNNVLIECIYQDLAISPAII